MISEVGGRGKKHHLGSASLLDRCISGKDVNRCFSKGGKVSGPNFVLISMVILSKDDIERLVQTIFNIPMATGCISECLDVEIKTRNVVGRSQ